MTRCHDLGCWGFAPAPLYHAPLPDELSERYDLVSQWDDVGAEGTIFEVAESTTGLRRVLKLYRPQVELQRESLQRIRGLGASGVARLINFGQLPDGRWWEVQELIEGGTLPECRDRLGGRLGGESYRW